MTTFAKTFSLLAVAATLSSAAYAATATVQLTPVADSYVNNTQPTTINGSATDLIANNSGLGVRVSFLRFDLSAIDPSTIKSAKLDLTVTKAAAKGYNIYGLIGASNESWDETGMTWNNAPAVINAFKSKPATLAQYLDTTCLHNSGAILADFTSLPTPGTETVFDVTSGAVLDFIKADSDKIVTFVIMKQDDTTANGTAWNSREAASDQPLLTITTQEPESSVYGLIVAGILTVAGLATAAVVVVRRRGKQAAEKLPPPPVNASMAAPAAHGRKTANQLPPPPQ